MVVVFVVCWIPLNALSIYVDIKSNDPNFPMPYFDVIFVTCHIFAMSSAVYNPLLYAWLSETFRRNLRSLVPSWHRKSATAGSNNAAPSALAAETVSRTRYVNDDMTRRPIESQTCSATSAGLEVLQYIQLQELTPECKTISRTANSDSQLF